MAAQSAENSGAVAAVLERFLCPGGKLRLSPYVEATQCLVLLGECPHPNRHAASLRELVGKPEHAAKFATSARAFLLEGQKVGFSEAFYAHRDSLDVYFAHYFPANLGKLQIVLLDLLRAGRLPAKLHLIDLGVGPGTSFVALLDFVLALGALADLAGTALPLQELSLRGYDRSGACLTYAQEVVHAFGQVLTGYGDRARQPRGPAGGPALASAWDLVEKALDGIQVQHGDIGGVEPIEFAQPSLLVLSYVLNYLHEQGSVGRFEASLAGLGEGSQLIVLEPGAQEQAIQLMRWRKSLVRRMPHWRPVLPCGQEFGVQLPASCDRCWCARHEDIHGSLLQRAYLGRLGESMEGWEPQRRRQVRRGFERLSWSYCVLAAEPHREHRDEDRSQEAGAQRYIGQRRTDNSGSLSVAEETSTAVPPQERRFVAFCPARIEPTQGVCRSARLVQEPGKVLPALRFGELVVLENVDCHQKDDEVRFTMNRASRIGPGRREPGLAFYDARPASLNALARRLFGFPALHDFQHKIIRRVLQGRHTLGIAATGAGKTECFLLPALLLPGLTVVVSPLKSLMQDQWERCDERYGLGALTTYINSDVDYPERVRRLQGMRAGHYKLAYFTPEQLARNHVRAVLQQSAVSVLAVDEAHCVSQWGHDFRPDYLNMVRRLRTCWDPPPVIVALTATASQRVRSDLCDPSLFNLDNRPVEEGGDVVFHGANRLELDLIVRIEPDAAARSRRILEDLEPFTRGSASGSAIVFMPYTGAHRSGQVGEAECSAAVEPFAAYLERQLDQRVATYHGQMSEGLQIEVGTFLRIKWQREDKGWGVYVFQGPDEVFEAAGTLREATPGVRYQLVGRWQQSVQYGWQFVFETAEVGAVPAPTDRLLGDVTGRDRRAEQRAFMRSQKRIMVATKSFGMGIDKADIRLIIHHSPPGDLLAYAQEVGRAARDGNRSRVILYFTEGKYPSGTRYPLTDRRIQEWFLEGRYVRETDLRACIAFLRQCQRRLEVHDLPQGTARRTYAVFSFTEVEAYFNALTKDPTPASLPHPYAWPAYKERHKVVQLTLEVLFKTAVTTTGRSAGVSLLESCQEVCTCLRKPILVNWDGLEDSNAELLREALHRESIGRAEFEALCSAAVTGDLLPLARRLNCTVEDTVNFLREASHWGVVHHLSLGTRGASTRKERSWEVCLSPALLSGEGMDALITSVVREHQRRRDEDHHDWELMLTQYVGVKKELPSHRCLRRVLLAFLHTGEDVVDAGCGACSGCCPDGDFLPLAERAGRIIAIPPELWSRLEAIRKAVDELPDIEVLRGICAFLESEDGVRWRHSVYLNTERMLREDSGSAGATALLICFISHRWLDRDEHDLHQLFDGFWRRRATLGSGLARLAEFAAEAWPESVTAAYCRARVVHAEDPHASPACWLALLKLEGVPRALVHEAAAALATGGDLQSAMLAARTSSHAEAAEKAYSVLSQVDLCSATVIQEETVAVFDAVGNERARAETLVGLLLAACRRGAPGLALVEMLDTRWSRIEAALSEAALVRLIEGLLGQFTGDSRWPVRFVGFLTGDGSGPLREAILTLCARFLEQGGRFVDSEKARIAAALPHIDSSQLHPNDAGLPCSVLEHLWDWAIEQQRADVVRSLCLVNLTQEGSAFRQLLLSRLMAKLLSGRRNALHKREGDSRELLTETAAKEARQ
jgi:superfamily II DNA helicase RecQ